jgi:hypothetical protein
MTNGFIARLLPVQNWSANASLVGINPAFGPSQLADPQPKAVVRTANYTAGNAMILRITIDLGADLPIDVIAPMFTNLGPAARWQIWASTNAQGPVEEIEAFRVLADQPFGVIPAVSNRRHALWTAPSPIARRYILVFLSDTAATGRLFIECGLVCIGRRLALGQGEYSNFELGGGRRVEDLSTIRTLPGGETYAERGARVPEWRATWSGVSEADYLEAWALLNDAGQSAPLLAVEDADQVPGQPEAMHYGLMTGLEFTERVQLDKQRLTLRIREML